MRRGLPQVPPAPVAPSRVPRRPMLGVCEACAHVWPVLWTPMDLRQVGKLANALFCPMCGERAGKVGTGIDTLATYVAAATRELARAKAELEARQHDPKEAP